MTSISQPPVLPPQAPSNVSPTIAQVHSPPASSGTTSPQAAVPAPATARSYASATRKPFSPPSALNNSTTPVAVGGSALTQYGKPDPTSPVNGKNPISPAVPSLVAPSIVNGNNAANVSTGYGDHSRKTSITISAAGTSGYIPNGGPVIGKATGGNGIQFGQIPIDAGGSPAPLYSPPQSNMAANSLAVNTPSNPRITSPQTSPSPIPQPPASGGRPPSSLQVQGNSLSFGSLGGEDASRQLRPNQAQGPLAPGPQPIHLRRESSQSAHSDMSNAGMGPAPGRGGYPQQAGRGRGYNPQYSQQMGYSPGPTFRSIPSQPRGGQNMTPQFPSQSRPLVPPYPNSPHQAVRSPALTNSQPIHPQQGQMPMPSPQMQQQHYGSYSQQMGPPQNQFMPQGFDPNYGYYTQQYGSMHAQIPYLPSPSSPRPPYHLPPAAQPQYIPGQYGNQQQPSPMSRTASAVSERPASSIGIPQTPMTPAMTQSQATSRGANSPAPKSTNFQIPPKKKSAGIVIKDPNSGAVVDVKDFDKQQASPAPISRSPAIISSTPAPTPPPRTPIHVEAQHQRTDSKSVRTGEERKNDMRDAVANVAKKLEADKAEERRRRDEDESKALKVKEEEAARLLKEKAEAEAKQLELAKAQIEAENVAKKEVLAAREAEEAATKAAEAEKARKEQEEEEEEELARLDAEMERKEAEAEERYQKKKQAEKEEQARKEADAAARLDEDLKKAEREAEAIEGARLKKLEGSEGEDSRKERVDMFATLKKEDSILQVVETAAAPDTQLESDAATPGTATPVSDTSMGPPALRAASGGKQKPAALKLETSKPVEAPQPSAALQSLRSARFLTSVNDVSYPAAIASPNPALNTAAPMGKFRYDKEFLMQFQRVFTEKPSETWTDKVKETVGDTSDTSSARPSTGRTPSMMGPRQPSNRPNVSGAFAMGTFGVPGGRTLPPGTTSQSRYEASTQAAARPSMQNPLTQFANRPGGFALGGAQPISRTASSTSLATHPQSPRSNTSRGPRGSKGGKPQRENDKDAKNMPLTAGTELKPIQVSATGWKPRSVGANAAGMAGPPPGGDGYLAPDVVQRKVKAALNKMTPNNFDKISSQILDIVAQSKQETDGRTLRQVIQLTFEKATDEAHWAQMYAEFCKRMLESMNPDIKDESLGLDKQGNVTAGGTLFRKYLLNRCQQEFERGWKMNLPEKPEGESEEAEAVMLSDEYYIAAAAKRRGLGLVRFIGELYKLGMLTARIMHMCVKKLVDYEGIPDEAEVESLTSLLRTIGDNLDSDEKGHSAMDAYFSRINMMVNTDGLPSRLKFMLMDIIDLRKKHWKTKDSAAKGPTTLEEVKTQAIAAEREKEIQRAQDSGSRRGGGGGGRMPLGRGDARNFSGPGQFGMPPPDYQKNTVGMDDLRRLGSKGGARQVSSQGLTFGPSSMFSSARGSNTRKPLGPGGFAGRGEDSGASSRTATPPTLKDRKEREEKEAATSANAFSALAGLDASGEPTDPASPPSATSSPPVAKASTLAERQRSKSPLGQDKSDDNAGGAL